MPEQLLLMADNLLLDSLYPSHVLTADQEAAGFAAWHVADGRRQAADRWQATTANADHWLKVRGNQLRGANCLVIDRESNHLDRTTTPATGKRFVLEASDDDFGTATTVFDVTVPVVPGGTWAGSTGALTDEESWGKTFPVEAAYDWRLTSKAMGAGLVPKLTGVWLGFAWQPADYVLELPLEDAGYRLVATETESPYAWVGRSFTARPRTGTLRIAPASDVEDDLIRWSILGLWARGYAAWLCWQTTDGAAQAILARCALRDLDYNKSGRLLRSVTVAFTEEQVRL